MAARTTLLTELPADAGVPGDVPQWVHLVPAGIFRGADGRGPYRLDDAARVAGASMQHGRLVIDENHATDHALTKGGAAPAQGWITAIEPRGDGPGGGLWGRVEWTPEGRAKLAAHAYRSLSPVILHDADGTILRVLRAGLTNAPNLSLTSLNTEQTVDMDSFLQALRTALGLGADADPQAILGSVRACVENGVAHTQQIGAIARAAGLDAATAAPAIVTALQTRAATAGDAERMARELVAMQTQLVELQTSRRREVATAAVDGAIRAGKPIPAALRDHYIARHMQDATAVETELAALPSLHTGGLASRMPAASGDGQAMSETDRAVLAVMNVDPKKFGETRTARLAASTLATTGA